MGGSRSGTNGYTEFMFASGYDNGYTNGDFYFSNFRVTNEVLRSGDSNNNDTYNAAGIVEAEKALANPAAYEAAPPNLPAGVTLTGHDLLTISDINGDGVFNNADIQALITDIKEGLPNGNGSLSIVPEPPSVLLLACALACCGRAFGKRFSGLAHTH